ncbi:MAG: hypothetical protein JW870_05150 [Candidatus Delongbacteria bacterium]|nr:hypothetical protein [Candidatus Delongbacteria bacterium]
MIMLYLRMKVWFRKQYKFSIILTLTLIGTVGLLLTRTNNSRFLFYSMLVPAMYYGTDKLFEFISKKIQGRDFYLFLRNSDDLYNHDDEISPVDMALSFVILGLIFCFTFFGALLFGKEDLFHIWFGL